MRDSRTHVATDAQNLVARRPGDVMDDEDRFSETTALLTSDEGSSSPVQEDAWHGLDDFKDSTWWHTPSVYWLLGPYALFTLAFGGVLVPKLNLILSLVCRQYYSDRSLGSQQSMISLSYLMGDDPQCNIPEVQSATATFNLLMNLTTGMVSAFVAPKFGQLSDRYGRSKLLASASVGGLCAEIITIFAAKYPDAVDYRWLIFGSLLEGATGSFTAGGMLAQTYVSDCTPPRMRAVSIGYLHACLFSGLALGPLLAGYFVKTTGSVLILFYIVATCHAIFILFIGFIIPDSMSKERCKVAQEKWAREQQLKKMAGPVSLGERIRSSNPFGVLRILWPRGPGTSFRLRFNLLSLSIGDIIITGTAMGVGPVIILYSKYIYDWGAVEGSFFVSAVSTVRVATLMVIFPTANYLGRGRLEKKRREMGLLVNRQVGADKLDIWVIRVSLAAEILGYVGFILAQDERIFFICGLVTALSGLGGATIQAAVTKHIPSDKLGQVLGAISMLQALARILGPVLFNGIYAATVKTFPQTFFIVVAGLFSAVLLSTAMLKPHVAWEPTKDDEAVNGDGEQEDGETAALNRGFGGGQLPLGEDQVII